MIIPQRNHEHIVSHFPYPPFLSLCQPLSCFLSQWIYLFWTFHKVEVMQYMDFCVWLPSRPCGGMELHFFPLCYPAVVQCAINIFTTLNIFLILSQFIRFNLFKTVFFSLRSSSAWPPHLILKELLTPFLSFFLCLFWIFVVLVWFTYIQDLNTSGIFLYIISVLNITFSQRKICWARNLLYKGHIPYWIQISSLQYKVFSVGDLNDPPTFFYFKSSNNIYLLHLTYILT